MGVKQMHQPQVQMFLRYSLFIFSFFSLKSV